MVDIKQNEFTASADTGNIELATDSDIRIGGTVTEPELTGSELRDLSRSELQKLQADYQQRIKDGEQEISVEELSRQFQEAGYGYVVPTTPEQVEQINEQLTEAGAIPEHSDILYRNPENFDTFVNATDEAGFVSNLAGIENAVFRGYSYSGADTMIAERLTPDSVAGRILRESEVPFTFVAGGQFTVDNQKADGEPGRLAGRFAGNSLLAPEHGGTPLITVDHRLGVGRIRELTGINSIDGKDAEQATNPTGPITNEVTEAAARYRLNLEQPGLGEEIVGSQEYQVLNLLLSSTIGDAEHYIMQAGHEPGDVIAMNEKYFSQADRNMLLESMQASITNTYEYKDNAVAPENRERLETELNDLIGEYAQSHPIFEGIQATVDPDSGGLTLSG